MPTFSSSARAAAVALVIAVSGTFGIASASAKTHTRQETKKHHVSKPHKRVHKRPHRKHAKKTTKKAVQHHKPAPKPPVVKPAAVSPATTDAPVQIASVVSAPAAAATPSTPPTTPTTPASTFTSPTIDPTSPTGIAGNWSTKLDSEFNGSSLNTSVWQTGWFGSGVTSPVNTNEQDCYSPSNVSFPGDGYLHLNVTAQSSTCGGVTKPYTGAIISSNPQSRQGGGFQYTYGVLQAEVYIPANGTQIANWPAVWTDGQSWPADGEDDVLEGLGGQACWHFHDPLGGPGACTSTIAPGWHTFASDWEPGSVTYYYDGVEVGSVTSGITSAPMYIILDNTVDTGQPFTPGSMEVKYVKVWQD